MGNDRVTLKHAPRFPAANLHNHTLCNAGVPEISSGSSTQIMK